MTFLPTHAEVTAPGVDPSRWMLVLHGILGSGGNFRSFARRLAAACPAWGFVLVDLRMHGQSQGAPPPHTLAAAADDLARLGEHLALPIAGAVVRAMRKPAGGEGSGGLEALTPRERQVLRLLAAGVSTRETAARRTISPKTVETHRVRIYAKLGCKSAVELTRIAVRTGLIEA